MPNANRCSRSNRNSKPNSPRSITNSARSMLTKPPNLVRRRHPCGKLAVVQAEGSRREGLLALIRENPSGLTRGEILERMGLKGNKSGEMSISNALTALTKGNQVSRQDGKYRVG